MNFEQIISGDQAPFSPQLIWGLAGLAALLTLVRAIFGKSLHPAWLQAPVVVLRWVSILLLACILLNASSSSTLPVAEAQSAILIDSSASMNLKAADGKTRWQAGTQFVADVQAALTAAGVPAADVSVFAKDRKIAGNLSALTPLPGGSETLISGALESLLNGGDAANLAQIVVISDGRLHDKQRLSSTLTAAKTQGVGVSTKVVGIADPPRNASLGEVKAPRYTRPKTKVSVPVEVLTTGFTNADSLVLVLTNDSGEQLDEAQVSVPLADAGPQRVEHKLSFTTGGNSEKYHVTLKTQGTEITMDDNRFSFTVDAVSTRLRVLMVEGTHVMRSVGSTGHWFNDIELMTKSWDATGEIEWEVLTPLSEYVDKPNLVGVKKFVNGQMLLDKTRGFPRNREEIFKYDVMLISDVPVGNFSEEQMKIVVDWVVERGGGFLMGGGYTSFDVGNYDKTPWEKITPVDMLGYGDGFFEHPFSISIPEAMQTHPIWQISPDPVENRKILATHPQFTGMNRVKRAKPGAILLAVRPEENNEPVFAAQNYGRGRSIAYLPDPNGGWARNTIRWGPPGGPVQGNHTELGHGDRFVFNERMANMAQGPVPPHPAPYYGQFWVNVVRWLGENSIRWRRDKLSGHVGAAQAYAGKELRVAAEVVAISSMDALLSQDLGVRLDAANSTRTRLTYDRDRREYVGSVLVPEDYAGDEVRVIFDTVVSKESLTDIISVGLQRTNQEYVESSPDPLLMQELAAAGGGKVLSTAADAVAAIIEARKTHGSLRQKTFHHPLWAQWPLWTALAMLLGAEWLLRRRGRVINLSNT